MRFRFRRPTQKKRLGARTSLKRVIRHSSGSKSPRGWGWLTSPKRAAYNRLYNRTTMGVPGCGFYFAALLSGAITILSLQ
jgi:hypothetical protein